MTAFTSRSRAYWTAGYRLRIGRHTVARPDATYMGLGSTAKKLQKLADVAEKLFTRVNEMRTEIQDLQSSVLSTEADSASVRRELAEQRAIVEAIADQQGIDVEAVADDADLPETAGSQTAVEDAAAAEGSDDDIGSADGE
jgi:septal ring factor EnvC (AmiA/AmiB activator)